MKQQRIDQVIGPPETVARLADMGLYPGQTVRVIHDGIWRVADQFTVAIRLTDGAVVLK